MTQLSESKVKLFCADQTPLQPGSFIFDNTYKNVSEKRKYEKDRKFAYFNTLIKIRSNFRQSNKSIHDYIFRPQPNQVVETSTNIERPIEQIFINTRRSNVKSSVPSRRTTFHVQKINNHSFKIYKDKMTRYPLGRASKNFEAFNDSRHQVHFTGNTFNRKQSQEKPKIEMLLTEYRKIQDFKSKINPERQRSFDSIKKKLNSQNMTASKNTTKHIWNNKSVSAINTAIKQMSASRDKSKSNMSQLALRISSQVAIKIANFACGLICTTVHIYVDCQLVYMSATPTYNHLLIKLVQYELLSTINSNIWPVYYSFSINPRSLKNNKSSLSSQMQQQNELLYFSCCMPNKTTTLTDDIIISGDVSLCQSVQLQRWENHMVMFTIDIDIAELRNRPVLSRKIQTMSGQVLKIIVIGLKDNQIKLGDKFIQSITQHYLFISRMMIQNSTADTGAGPSYFCISTEQQQYMIPVMDSKVVIKIPQTLQFSHIKNSKCISRSQRYNFNKLQFQPCIIPLQATGGNKTDQKLSINLEWGINLLQIRPQSSLLLDSQQINIYDIQIKLDVTDVAGLKAKLVSGNKGFQLGAQFTNTKGSVVKIRKIVNFIAKSDQEQIVVLFQKNLKTIALAKIQIQEIVPFSVHSIKRKMTDMAGKPFGSLKFKCEKAKTLSSPSNNKFWRQSSKTSKSVSNLLVAFDQISVKYQFNQQVVLSLKTQSQEKIVKKIPNFKFFNQNSQVSKSIFALNLKPDESIYMVLRRANTDESDFIGIAVFNPSTVRLGQSFTGITFFKNQIETIILNCQVNKISAYPFIKHVFQPQLLQSLTHRSLSLSIVLRQIQLGPYFYTFRYENKNEVYSIVQVNRNKKVLILENKNKSNQLAFNCSASSDNLDFCIEETQTIKVKITFLVSDLGQNEEIYGWATVKFKVSELEAANPILKFYLIQIKNDFGSNLGQINLEVHKAALFNSHEKQSRDILQSSSRAAEGEKRKLKMHLAQISQSVELKQKDKSQIQEPLRNQSKSINIRKGPIQQIPELKKPSARYQKIMPLFTEEPRRKNHSVLDIEKKLKLPAIRQESASPQGKKSYNQLVHMMKIRRRSTKGHYQENSMLQSYQLKDYNHRSILKSGKYDDAPTETMHLKQKIEKQNPNLSRNMEILFPKKNNRLEKNISYKRPISQEQKKFKGLKSVLNQISSDMGQIEPTVKDEQNDASREKVEQKVHYEDQQTYHLQGPEWNDNEFAV